MAQAVDLPQWPPGTVAILVTAGARPHAIPVSAIVRAGRARALVALAAGRGSLARLRERPEVTLAVLASGLAFSADGRATVAAGELIAGMVAVAIDIDAVHDHMRPTFTIETGVSWRWTDPSAQRRDAEVRAALERLAAAG